MAMARSMSRGCRVWHPVLFICDIQEKFRPVIYEYSKLIATTTKMLKAASTLQMPVYVTTQNRARLGETVSEIQPYLTGANVRANIDKTLFSMMTPETQQLLDAEDEKNAVALRNRPQDVIIVGIESHICVTQTTLDLLSTGRRVYVLADGVSSCNAEERGVALARLRDAGAVVTTSESILFEILGDASSAEFKAISGLVKETKEDTKSALAVFSKM